MLDLDNIKSGNNYRKSNLKISWEIRRRRLRVRYLKALILRK